LPVDFFIVVIVVVVVVFLGESRGSQGGSEARYVGRGGRTYERKPHA